MEHWPELREAWNNVIQLVFPCARGFRRVEAACFYCGPALPAVAGIVSHMALITCTRLGFLTKKFRPCGVSRLSDLFTDAERAALRLAMAAGVAPNMTEPENFVELRKHFTNIQIIEILAVIAAGGYLNRWNDTIATVTDQESIDFADQVLRQVGWNEGKHVGAKDEQRKAHPITLGWSKK